MVTINPMSENYKSLTIRPNSVSFLTNPETQPKAIHEDIEIKYFYEGTSTLLVGSKTVTAEAGDIIIINPYEFHTTIDCGKKTGKYHLFIIPLNYFTNIGIVNFNLRDLLLLKRISFNTKLSNPRMAEILIHIANEQIEQSASYQMAIHGLLTEFFALLLRDGLSSEELDSINDTTMRTYNLIEPALRHIRDNFSEYITVEALSQLCKTSKYHFCRVFKSVTGQTAIDYLNEYRLKCADALLKNSDRSISYIADSCGFSSEQYFCRCYKQKFGLPPGKCKKNKSDW